LQIFSPLACSTGERWKGRLLADNQFLMLLRDVALDFALEDQVGLKEQYESSGFYFLKIR
jgi:hypothetical protein